MTIIRNVPRYFLVAVLLAAASLPGAFASGVGDKSAKSGAPAPASTGLSKELLKLVNAAVFEVVVEKAQTDSLVYERELNWSMVPYAIRTDKYESIGTAFAISGTELITAFHVIDLGWASMVYDRYFIRDSGGRVSEVDKVVAGSNEKDFLIFTVKDRTFTEYFKFEEHFEVNDSVYSIGNALGEGIVIRNGLILGTIPEDEAGRWNRLKSSADVNPGNSGGPLVTPGGKVVSLVTSKLDNMLYSIPASVILETKRDELRYRLRRTSGHVILANTVNRVFETAVPLPEDYKKVLTRITEASQQDYEQSMVDLFNAAPEYLTGPNNMYLLNTSVSSSFPEVEFVDTNDNNWKLSDLEVKNFNLPDDGRISHASVTGFNIYKITRPLSVPLKQINTDPRFILDTILQSIRTERTLVQNDKYRILSFGDPMEVTEYKDALGRSWITATWRVDFNDAVIMLYILPLPNGPAVINTYQSSSQRRIYEWDIRKLCDHVHASYSASFTGWDEFIAMDRESAISYIPDFLGDIKFDWNPDVQEISLEAEPASVNASKDVFDWNSTSELHITSCWYQSKNPEGKETIEFGLRRILLYRNPRHREYAILYKNIKPDPRRGTVATENWNELVEGKFPFDGQPAISVKDNTGSVGAMLEAKSPSPDVLYTLYLSMENPGSEENLSRRLGALKAGVQVKN